MKNLRLAIWLATGFTALPCLATTYPVYINVGGGSFFNGSIQYEAGPCYGQAVDWSDGYTVFNAGYDRTLYHTAEEASSGGLFNCGDFMNNDNGTTTHHYNITLKFVDQVAWASGQRVFDVWINRGGGVIDTLVANVDIFAAVGQSTAYTISLSNVAVSSLAFRITMPAEMPAQV